MSANSYQSRASIKAYEYIRQLLLMSKMNLSFSPGAHAATGEKCEIAHSIPVLLMNNFNLTPSQIQLIETCDVMLDDDDGRSTRKLQSSNAHENHLRTPDEITIANQRTSKNMQSKVHTKSVETQDRDLANDMYSLLGHPLPIATPK